MSSAYTPSSAGPPPSTIDLPTDDMPQRATTYNPTSQELADWAAFLQRVCRDNIGANAAAMQAVTVGSIGDRYFIPLFGWYSLVSGSPPAQVPWVYAATGIGSGYYWVHELWQSLLDQRTSARIRSAVFPCGSTSDMVALTSASENDLFFVRELGWFTYHATGYTADSRFVWNAVGVGSGYWVSELTSVILAGSPYKLLDSLLSYRQMVLVSNPFTTNPISYAVASSWEIVNASGNNLSITLGGLATGDEIECEAGPFLLDSPTSGMIQLQLRLHVAQNGVDSYYPLNISRYCPSEFSSSPPFDTVCLQAHYQSNSNSNAVITIEAKAASGIHIFTPTVDGTPTWGPAGTYRWGNFKILRQF